jgi:hypothetical protein
MEKNMKNPVFGELVFDTGWKAKTAITLFGKQTEITVKLKAYFEKDGITVEQEKACLDYSENKEEKTSRVEELLTNYTNGATERFVAKILLFNRNGSYALLLDDKENAAEDIAVCLAPAEKVLLQEEYL